MKIIISPSKTQNFENIDLKNATDPIFSKKANHLVKQIKAISKGEMAKKFKIKGKILEATFENYLNFGKSIENKAVLSYTGLVFKQLELDLYSLDELKYLNENVIILSALYGLLRPFDKIKPYRLDFTISLDKVNLYKYFEQEIKKVFADEESIINLASNEFSKLVNKDMINIHFREINKEGKLKNKATYSKIMRGKFLDYMIKNKISSIEKLKKFNEEGCTYSKEHSDESNFIFIYEGE